MGTGPHWDYAHRMRRDNAYVHQRAVYLGYKHIHRLTGLTLMTPDRVNFIYGPYFIRNDDPRMILMSGMDTFLEKMKNGYFPGGVVYAA